MRLLLPSAVLACALLFAGCWGDDDSPSATPASEATSPATTATSSPSQSAAAVTISDPTDRTKVQQALASLGAADVEVSDQPIAGATAYVVQSWAVITDQRRDVLEMSLHDIGEVLAGNITDWSSLGGSSLPIAIALPADNAEKIARLFAPDGLASDVARLPIPELLQQVADEPGTLALVPVEALQPGVLALIVDDHDPYRDPAADSPLLTQRWVRSAGSPTADEVARALGWDGGVATFDPVGVLATGDFIPARCTWTAMAPDPLSAVAGVRDLMRAADLTIVPMEIGLMTSNPATPCVSTTVLQGQSEAVQALVDTGTDVIARSGNHAFDCWGACAGIQVLSETNEVLRQAGIPWTGVGDDLAEARTPAIVERGGLRFALLSYDDIAPWYFASPGGAGTAPLDLSTLADDVRAAKAQADHVFVAWSAGIEYQAEPTDRQREAARIAAEAGASLVIGNHPHWVQATEWVGDTFVMYALGNFVFDQPWSLETQQGMLFEAGFLGDRMIGYRLRPHIIVDNHRPTLLDLAGDGAGILNRVWGASDQLGSQPPPFR